MKKSLLILVVFLTGIVYSQEIDYSKIPQIKVKELPKLPKIKKTTSYPLEMSLSFGMLYNFSDSIEKKYKTTYTDTSFTQYLPTFILDSTVIKKSYNIGLRKRINKFRFGVDFSYVTSSNNINDYLNDFKYNSYDINGNYYKTYIYDYTSSEVSNKMNSKRLKFNIDYVLYEKDKSSICIGLGFGFSNTILKFKNTNQYTLTVYDSIAQILDYTVYSAYENSINYLYKSMFVSPSFSYEYKLSSHFKFNTNISLFIPLNNKLSRTGFTNSYSEIGVPFNGIYQNQTEVVDYIVTQNYTREYFFNFKNPIQIGLNVGLVYTLGKKNK